MQRLLFFFKVLPILLLLSCSGNNSEDAAAVPLEKSEGQASEEEPQGAIATPAISNDLFDCYDAVEQLLKTWNSAIDEHQPEQLRSLYAEQLMCYTNYKSNEMAVKEKSEWLKVHASYRQSLKSVEVYYNEGDTTRAEFAAKFIKVCKEKGRANEVLSWLYFRQVDGVWKIVKETDASTEIAKANKSKNGKLIEGKNQFYRGYWVDTRGDENFAHDQVPYRYALDLEVGPKITGTFWNYSGRMRTTTTYDVHSGYIENGILLLKVAYHSEEDESEEMPALEVWRFRVVSENEIVGIDKDNPYTYGVSFPRSE